MTDIQIASTIPPMTGLRLFFYCLVRIRAEHACRQIDLGRNANTNGSMQVISGLVPLIAPLVIIGDFL